MVDYTRGFVATWSIRHATLSRCRRNEDRTQRNVVKYIEYCYGSGRLRRSGSSLSRRPVESSGDGIHEEVASLDEQLLVLLHHLSVKH